MGFDPETLAERLKEQANKHGIHFGEKHRTPTDPSCIPLPGVGPAKMVNMQEPSTLAECFEFAHLLAHGIRAKTNRVRPEAIPAIEGLTKPEDVDATLRAHGGALLTEEVETWTEARELIALLGDGGDKEPPPPSFDDLRNRSIAEYAKRIADAWDP